MRMQTACSRRNHSFRTGTFLGSDNMFMGMEQELGWLNLPDVDYVIDNGLRVKSI
jgi:hypothetical protein